MADVAQLVRALVCGTGGRGFKTHHSPQNKIPRLAIGILFEMRILGSCTHRYSSEFLFFYVSFTDLVYIRVTL